MSVDDNKEREFIKDLESLTRKYGISIGGCGCCGSPWLDDEADVSDENAGYSFSSGELRWVAPSDNYDWENYASGIIK